MKKIFLMIGMLLGINGFAEKNINKNNVKITKISNTFKEPSAEKIEQMLDINISVDGGFKDIVGYINAIEESKLVVDVSNIDINSTNGKLNGNLGVYVWGMKYQ